MEKFSVFGVVLVKLLASYLHKLRSEETQLGRFELNFNGSARARLSQKPRRQFYDVLFIIFSQLNSAKVCHSTKFRCVCILCTHARYARSRNDFVTLRTIGINYIKMGFTVSCVSTRAPSIYCFACFDFAIYGAHLKFLHIPNCRKTYWPNPDAYSNYIIHHEISMA